MDLLDMSIAGGVVILAVTVVRALGVRRLPRATFTVLWAVALVRLLIPAAAPSAVSVYAWLTPPAAEEHAAAGEAVEALTTRVPVLSDLVPATVTAGTTSGPAAVRADQSAKQRSAPEIPWRTLIWAAGALSCAGVFAESYLKARRRFREAVSVEDGFVRRWQAGHPLRRRVSVRLSGRVKAPVTYGVFRPVVLLPASTDWNDEKTMGFILAHEYGHIRRLDGLKKLVLAAAVSLHWFNPLAWVMLTLANRDMEMACDEYVVRSMGGDSRAAYARTLIRLEETRAGLSPLVSHFSANAMEERIISIMKCKKLTAWAVVMSLLLTVGVTAVFATAPPEQAAEADPGPYDWGEAVVLVPMREENVEKHFADVPIQWWEPDDFAAWVKEQKPLLEAAVGSEPGSGCIVAPRTWTEERSEKVLAAYEDIAAALEAGTGKLSRTVGGSGQVVVAVGFDWPLDTGSEKTVRGYDVEALLWGAEDDWPDGVTAQTYSVELAPGERWADFGPSQTQIGLVETVHAYFLCMVQAGAMDSGQANEIQQDLWTTLQGGELLDRYVIGDRRETDGAAEAAETTPAPTPVEFLAEPPEPALTPAPVEFVAETSEPAEEKLGYEDLRPQYVWDLTGGSGVVREEDPAGGADYLLDIKPYGYRTPVNVEYVSGVQSVSALLQPGKEAVVGQSEGTYETLVIFRDDGQVTVGCRGLDGSEETPYAADPIDVTAGSFNTGSNGWTVEGGTEFFVRNTGDAPIHIDGFMYER